MTKALSTNTRWLLFSLIFAVCFCCRQLLESASRLEHFTPTAPETIIPRTLITDEELKQDELLHWGSRTYAPNRVLCAVPTTWEHSAHGIRRLQNSWGPLCDKLLFVIASGLGVPSASEVKVGEILVVNMTYSADPEGRNIWQKVHLMWSAISDIYINDYEWFLKVDDDTFLFVDHLKKFLQYYNPNIPRYLGHTLLFRWKHDNIVFNAGSAYVLSREALARLAVKLKIMPVWQPNTPLELCHDRPGPLEDPSVAICLQELGIWPENTLSSDKRQRFLPFQLHQHYTQKRNDEESWFWKYKPRDMGVEENCCVPEGELISAHAYKHKLQNAHFYKLHKIALATRKYTPPVPPKPMLFQYEANSLDFELDEWRNSKSANDWRPKFPRHDLKYQQQ